MAVLEEVLVLVAACLGFALLSRRLRVPYATTLVLGGMALAFVPDLPEIPLDPELALALFLPPLLQASAFRTDWRGFRRNIGPILVLAVGGVAFTAACVAAVAKLLVPELPWTAAVALGAIVAPPDAVAAGSVLQRVRLPRGVVTILEGESLINDAAALVLYRFAVSAAATAGAVSLWEGPLGFVAVAAGGIAVGWAAGEAAIWTTARLGDTILETALGFLVGYASYFAAEALDLSGVIAVVTTGIVFGQAQYRFVRPETRLAARTVWRFLEFILNSLVFVLIGLQLNAVLDRLDGRSPWAMAGIAAAVSAALIASRFAWVFPTAWLPRLVPAVRRHGPAPTAGLVAVVSWAGMRGVVSLAAALALPLGFPQRDLIVFLAFIAILATLVVQGATLEWVIKRLRVGAPEHEAGMDPMEAEGRRLVAQAALELVEGRLDDPLDGAIAADLVPEFRVRAGRLHRAARSDGAAAAAAAERAARRALRLAALDAGRSRLLRHHADGHLHDEALAKLAREIDLEEMRLREVLGGAGAGRTAVRPPHASPAPTDM